MHFSCSCFAREKEPFETAAVKRFIAIALKIEQENYFNKNLLKREPFEVAVWKLMM